MGVTPRQDTVGTVLYDYDRRLRAIETYPGGAKEFTQTFSYTGTCMVTAGQHRLYLEQSGLILGVRASVGTAPTGNSMIIDVNKNGSTIWSNQANRATIAAGAYSSGYVTSINTSAFAAGDYLTVDIDQVGSSVPGGNLSVTVQFRYDN